MVDLQMLDARKRMRILDVARSFLGVPYDHARLDASWQEAVPVAFDNATFVCRVAMEALEDSCSLQANAGWLLDNLAAAESPIPGDVVGYQRASRKSQGPDLHHVMIYAGSGNVIGACDLAGCVVVRPIDYEATEGQWSLIAAPSFRLLGPRRKSGPMPASSLRKR